MLLEKATIASTPDLEDFRPAILDRMGTPLLEVNAKLVMEDLLDRASKEEEKEVNIHPQMVKDLADCLGTIKDPAPYSLRMMNKIVKAGIR